MTTWNRRVSSASGKSAIAGQGRTGRTALLAEAMAAGVVEEDQKALMAMANIARDRPGFSKTLEVRARGESGPVELVFEIAYGDEGPIVRLAPPDDHATGRHAAAESAAPAADDEPAIDVVSILTDTMVETPDLVAVFASVGHEALWANDAFVTVIPIRQSDKVWLVELLDEWSKGHYEVKVLPALVKYGRWRGRLTLISGSDASLPVSAVIVAHRDRQGEIEAVSMVARDVEPPADAAAIGSSPFAALVEHASDIIAVVGADGTIRYASPAAARLLDRSDGALVGADLMELLHPDDRPTTLADLARPDELGISPPVELRVAATGDEWRHLEAVVTDLSHNPAVNGYVLNARDVTDRVASVNELANRALRDELTGLPSRVKLLDHLSGVLPGAPANSVAVLLVDVDRVRNVNEHLGRDAGDELIRTVAQRLADEVLGEHQFVARLGGDEFVVVLAPVNQADAVAVARRLRDVLAQPMQLAGGPFDVTASVGLTMADDADPDVVLRNADQALAQAKDAGRDRLEVYTDEMARVATRRRSAEQAVRQALDNDELRVHYQPIVELPSRRRVAAEALLRVRDGEGAVLSPAEFIEAAESSGLIARLGSQVLSMACEQLAGWSLAAGDTPGELSVNVSPRQLADPALPTRVVEALQRSGVGPERLWLEITESILIGGQSTIDASIQYLRTLGVRIGLDDFGAGASSLGYLKRFPLDFVKIDRSLIAGVGVNEQDTAIVRATIELAHTLGLVVVAVGVENDQQLEYLELLGCDRAQGYRFSPAIPAEDFLA